ncbi:MAG: Asp23/Gls24 family envelope stress response protein, partial [Lachnospiraceae bacterium]|nr:Asp23/Gls24 family envelope stress response protein [Lachnospiraceae bacterium]
QNKLCIDFHIIVAYGVSISAVADNLIENVKYKVEDFSGIEVERINVFVEGVRVTDC